MFQKHSNKLVYTTTHTFFSGYGQTFFMSLFRTDIQEAFLLKDDEFGNLYSVATLLSSLLLPIPGKLIDKNKITHHSFIVGIILFCSMFLIAFAKNWVLLGIGFFLLRISAQALLPHIATTSISRYFKKFRGTFLGITNLGHSLGEGILPIIAASLLQIYSWNIVFMIFAGLIPLIFLPVVTLTIHPNDKFNQNKLFNHKTPLPKEPSLKVKTQNRKKNWDRKRVLKDPFFYFILPSGVLPAFLLTGFFLFFSDLIEVKKWSASMYTYGFIGFALSKSITSFSVGILIDKFTARRLVPFSLLPLFVGFIGILYMNNIIFLFIYLITCGISIGFQMSLKSALWAEVYGTKNLGSIQSLFSTFVFLSSAIAPALLGFLIKNKIDILEIIFYSIIIIFISTILSIIGVSLKSSKIA